ncbi:MAG: L-serine ammonia-lyase, iron-sulfur-dependent, subunit alpha [bacterium]
MKSTDVERLLLGEITEVVGCTEPAALAHAVQCAKRHLRDRFDVNTFSAEIELSPEVFRNASTAVVPVINKRGIRQAVIAGLLSTSNGFNPFVGLKIPPKNPLFSRRSWLKVIPSKRHGIYVRAELITPKESIAVTIRGRHDSIVAIEKNRKVVYRKRERRLPRLRGLKEIAKIVERRDKRLESLAYRFVKRQVKGDPGKTPSKHIVALITGRMCGKSLPVLTITGSGNQGIFLGAPLFSLYREKGRRALPAVLFALLTQIYLSQLRKRISHECGLATKAAPALAAGLAYEGGADVAAVRRIMGTVYGRLKNIPCPGAKPSCGAKGARALRCVLEALDT